MGTRTINIALVEQTPKARTLRFFPALTSTAEGLLLEESYTVITDPDGTGSIDLPVNASGSIQYDYELPAGDGKTTGRFYLTAGAAIDLAALIVAGGAATDTIQDYIDDQINAAVSGFTPGSAIFADEDGTISEDSPAFFYDEETKTLKLLDKTYTPLLGPNVETYFNIGSETRIVIPTASALTGMESDLPLTISGDSKYYVGNRQKMDLQGTSISPQIIGSWTSLFTNALFLSGTSRIYGTYSNVDLGAPFTEAYGGLFTVNSGGSGATGAGTLVGVMGAVGMAHNANTDKAFAGDFWLCSSTSSPSVVNVAAAVRARATLQTGVTVSVLRGLSLTDWVNNGGAATISYGIYADASIDIGTTKYFIYSLSTSPSFLSGQLSVPYAAYDRSAWSNNIDVPTKKAVVEALDTKTTKTDLTLFGLPHVEGVELVQFRMVLASGANDVYTPPAGKKALISSLLLNNTTAGAITVIRQVKIAGSYFRTATIASVSANNNSASLPSNYVLDSNTTLAINASGVGLVAVGVALLMPDTASFKAIRISNLGLAQTTLYQVPAGKKATVLPEILQPTIFNSSFAVRAINDSGGTVSITGWYVPSGGIVETANQLAIFSIATGAQNAFAVPILLLAGDKLVFQSNSATAGQHLNATIFETDA